MEHFGAHVFRYPTSGITYLVAGSDAIHFWQIQNLGQVARFSGQAQFAASGIFPPVILKSP